MTNVGRVTFEREGSVAVITLDRPDKHNAYTPQMYEEMTEAFKEFDQNPDLHVAILTGAGERAFCAGADLSKTIGKLTDGGKRHWDDPTKRFFSDIFKPIITAVNGLCISGGLEILQGTDIRIAVPHATFGLGEVRWGITPGGGSHTRLPRQIPWAVAMEILLLGRTIDAERAREVGLVNQVVEPDQLMDTAMSIASTICQNGPLAVRAAKEIAVRGQSLGDSFALEYYISDRILRTEDAKEGPRAFAEKRPAEFKGR